MHQSVDVIIVNHESTDLLIQCVRSIYASAKEIPISIYVQDNNSNDGVERIKEKYPEIRLMKNRLNIGYSRAVNQALKQGNSPYVFILNPDVIVSADFFEPILDYMEEHADVGILGSRILNTDGSVQGSARTFPTPLTGLFGRNSLLTKVFPNNPITRANILVNGIDGKKAIEVDWVSGACMLIQRAAVNDVGPLDNRFFMYWEDADWCRRAWQKGWKVVYYPGVSVIHHVGGSSEKNLIRTVLEFHKSSYLLYRKYAKPQFLYLSPLAFSMLVVRFLFILPMRLLHKFLLFLKKPSAYERVLYGRERRHKIKVLRIIARLNIGGPAIHVNLLSEGLNEKKFQSMLLTGRISQLEGDMSYLFESSKRKFTVIPELQREISLRTDFITVMKILKVLRTERPDIIHTHTAKAGTNARMAAIIHNLICRNRIKVVHTFHGHVFEGYFSTAKSRLFIWIERFLAKFTDVIIAISESQKKEIAQKFRIAPAKKIEVIRLGFDLGPFLENSTLKGQFRRQLGIDDDTLLIGIIGRLAPIKNHIMYLKAAKMFLENNPGIRTKFIIVGDGELRDELEAYCRDQNLCEHVRFCGWIRNMPMVYADLDILALTSINEGTPVSVIEAMASSVPVISTAVGGIPDLLGNPLGVTTSDKFIVCERGILCGKEDTNGIAQGFGYIVDMNDLQKAKQLRNACAFAQKEFSVERLLDDMETLYLRLLLNKKDSPNFKKPESAVRDSRYNGSASLKS